MQEEMDRTLSMHGKQEMQRKIWPETLKRSEHLGESKTGETMIVKLIFNKEVVMSGFICLRVSTKGKLL
jgi:hypothetical protein